MSEDAKYDQVLGQTIQSIDNAVARGEVTIGLANGVHLCIHKSGSKLDVVVQVPEPAESSDDTQERIYRHRVTLGAADHWRECVKRLVHLTAKDLKLFSQAIKAKSDLEIERQMATRSARDFKADTVQIVAPDGEVLDSFAAGADEHDFSDLIRGR